MNITLEIPTEFNWLYHILIEFLFWRENKILWESGEKWKGDKNTTSTKEEMNQNKTLN